ncbi:hypothetical protein FIU97_18245 [Roseivivax sp. THAF40]|uniref:PRC-barrel domain-containing protein n=1 Tax=unclassified Roseivivax TaxID=2639302 RepID=UPI0012695910|nr:MULTISPECIES: PRC-barrel domain-containing protein [unclassified Roseivivax]QFS84705.1 hypothetical protein FIV09_17835 [Roseivivax sp. THAF197b]QFT48532.1 hypothetical protein FIU97_18245 [Roseivivax sp. THAF40]
MTLKTLMMSAATAALLAGGAVHAQDTTEPETETEAPMEDTDSTMGTSEAENGMATDAPVAEEAEDGMETDTDMAEDEPMSLEAMTVGEVIGLPVQSTDGDSIGEIDYLIEGDSGLEAVIGIGGFLGLGEYTVALPLDTFDFNPDEQVLTLAATKDELTDRQEFDESGVESLPDDMLIGSMMGSGEVDASSMGATGDEAMSDTEDRDTTGDTSATSGTMTEEDGSVTDGQSSMSDEEDNDAMAAPEAETESEGAETEDED